MKQRRRATSKGGALGAGVSRGLSKGQVVKLIDESAGTGGTHTPHTNQPVLDGLSIVGGKLYLNGQPVDSSSGGRAIVTVAQALSLPGPNVGDEVFVLDDHGGSIPAFFDGINWLRVTDRKIIHI